MVSKGRNGFIGVGFSSAEVKLDRLPGWEPHSFGYHGDDGNAFHESGKGIKYGPTFGTGDKLLTLQWHAASCRLLKPNHHHVSLPPLNI